MTDELLSEVRGAAPISGIHRPERLVAIEQPDAQPMKSAFVLRAAGLPEYAPANHTGTSNQRIVCMQTVGARRVEILLGTITRGHGALPHAHPDLEQAGYVLAGEGVSDLPGRRIVLRAGDWGFNAAGEFHRFEVLSEEPVRVMVIYAPPYSERPGAAVVADAADDPRVQARPCGARDVPCDAAPVELAHYRGARVRPVISPSTVGARFLDISMVDLADGAGAAPHALPAAEQVLYVRSGGLEGRIDNEPFEAVAGEWVFVPENAVLSLQARGGAACSLILIRAHDATN